MASVFTSLPPRISRIDRHGVDIGEAYLRRCIASWLDAGHRLISVNGPEEIAEVRARFPEVECRAVHRTAANALGRPFVYVSDIIAACAGETGMVGIVNADLQLRQPDRLAAQLRDLAPGAVLCSRRLDVDDLDAPQIQNAYAWGWDCFFFAPAVVEPVADEGFVFGICWWDYWFPLLLASRGHRLVLAEEPVAGHLHHSDHQMTFWVDYLHRFVRAMTVRLPLPGNDAVTDEANRCFGVFLRHFNPQAQFGEQLGLGTFLTLIIRFYAERHPTLAEAVRAAWLQVLPQDPAHAAYVVFRPLIESIDAVCRDAAARRADARPDGAALRP